MPLLNVQLSRRCFCHWLDFPSLDFGPLFSEAFAAQPAIRPVEVSELDMCVTDGASCSCVQPAGNFFASVELRVILVDCLVVWAMDGLDREPDSLADCFPPLDLAPERGPLCFGHWFEWIGWLPGHSGV